MKDSAIKVQLRRNPASSTKVGDTIISIDEGLVGLSTSFQQLVVESRSTAVGAAESIRMLALRVSNTNSMVGSMDIMEASVYASPTVWSSIATMGVDLQTVLKRKVELPDAGLKALQGKVDTLEIEVRSSSEKLKNQVIGLASGMSSRMSKAEAAIRRNYDKSNGPTSG